MKARKVTTTVSLRLTWHSESKSKTKFNKGSLAIPVLTNTTS